MRELLTHPSIKEFTQGSIFEGLNVNQDNPYTNAIVVTARCDIANGKARNILCLPIYKATDWIKSQGDEIIFKRIEGKLENKLKSELSKFSLSLELSSIYPPKNIIELIERNGKYKDTGDVKKLFNMYSSRKCDYSLKFVSDERSNLINSLLRNTENSIYFLEQISFDEVLEPYIIDFSDPISMPYSIAIKLLKGIKKQNIDDSIGQYLTLYKKEISYISVLKSPYIEHVLQQFSNFYSRIGTEDIEKDSFDFLKGKFNEI